MSFVSEKEAMTAALKGLHLNKKWIVKDQDA